MHGTTVKIRECLLRILEDLKSYKWAVVCIVLYYLLAKFLFSAFCPAVIITGFPCPGCGMIRAIFFTATGQFVRGWNLNPFAGLWLILAVWCAYRKYWCGKKEKRWKQMACIILVGMFILFIYRCATRFPSYAPIVYTGKNIFSKVFNNYETILRHLNII